MGTTCSSRTLPVMAAVVSVPMAEPRNTPWGQSKASKTSGTTRARRDPKMKPEMGTPCGSSQLGSIEGHCRTGAVNRELGCAAAAPPGCQALPCQSTSPAGGSASIPSHQGSPDGVNATLVKMVLERTVAIPFGLVSGLVLGATPKKPRSGLIARSWPWASTWIQAMSSPTVHTRYPGSLDTTMARLVLPEALGMVAAR